MKDVTDEIVKVDHFTSKLSFDKGLQVLKDVLSYTHFQFIWSKIDYKENRLKLTPDWCHTQSHNMLLGERMPLVINMCTYE